MNAKENLEKDATPFHEWIKKIDPAFLVRHLIPAEPELWEPEAFPRFLVERERLILDRLFSVLDSKLFNKQLDSPF